MSRCAVGVATLCTGYVQGWHGAAVDLYEVHSCLCCCSGWCGAMLHVLAALTAAWGEFGEALIIRKGRAGMREGGGVSLQTAEREARR